MMEMESMPEGYEALNDTALKFIDQLLDCWEWWDFRVDGGRKELVPVGGNTRLTPEEQQIVYSLRRMLSPEEWNRLPALMEHRHARRVEENRERVEVEKKVKEEKAREVAEIQQKRINLLKRVRSVFETDFLKADERFRCDVERDLLSDEEYSDLKIQFTKEWVERELKESVDDQQAAAIAAVGGDIQVVARAGSGKTRTLVARVLFLLKHCRVSPRELLLLAFNKDAAAEMRSRLSANLNGAFLPHVMTFHALAYAIASPKETLVCDDRSCGNLGLSREIQGVIDEHLKADQYRTVIRDLMLMHFRDDWERIVEGGFHLPIEELIKYREALPRETLKGEYVKSFGEKFIANALFQHGVEYKYEKNFRWSGVNYKPDFTIHLPNGRGVVIEYFGMAGDSDYDEMSTDKRRFWSQKENWVLLEFSPLDITSRGLDGFTGLLLDRLQEEGVAVAPRLSDEELWERIERRAIDSFTGATHSFVSRCRKRNLHSEAVRELVARHKTFSEVEALFLKIGVSVYSGYLRSLEKNQKEDFDGLIWRAVSILRAGSGRFVRDKGRERGDVANLRFVLVDEFQDFSEMFYELARGIRSLSPKADFFCVGDDWQAINGFAGSDLTFFERFEEKFRATKPLDISTNYRSPIKVVELGNALMAGRGNPAKPNSPASGWVRVARMADFNPLPIEQERHEGDEVTPALLRLLQHLLQSSSRVVMLSRKNSIPWYVRYSPGMRNGLDGLERFAEHIRSFFPEEDRDRITASTTHKFKGLEADAVIVLDAIKGSYPLVHPNWIFLRVFGDTLDRIEAEERRLFYVALTRSKKSLVILSDDQQKSSPFLADIAKRMTLPVIDWRNFQPISSIDGAKLEVRVSKAYGVKDLLKQFGYRWNADQKCWWRLVPESGFDLEALCGQPWATNGVHIEIYTETQQLRFRND